jgi:hypothetical protein
MVNEVVFREPSKPVLVNVEARESRGRRTRGQKSPDRLTFIESESGNVNQGDDVRSVGTHSRHDLSPVRMPDYNGGAILAVKHLTQSGHVVNQRRFWKLRGGDVVPGCLEPLNDGRPARSIGPSAVNEDNIRKFTHCGSP